MPETHPTPSPAPLPDQRHRFFLDDGDHFLNCAYMAPMLDSVEAAGIAGVRSKRRPHAITPEDFFAPAERVRSLFARLVGSDEPERVALVPAVSYGLAVVARNLAVSPGQRIVVTAEQFPSNVYAWRPLLEAGARMVTVGPRDDDAPAGPHRSALWNRRLLEAITPDTALVALPPVHWTDGTRIDLESLGQRAREVGAAFVVDGTQSVGALPFDVASVQPDALVVAGYKWLLGPYSTGLAWLGPRFDGGRPLEETWIARAGSEDFAGLVDYEDEYAPGAARYDVGQRSNFVLLPMLEAALEQVLAWTPERIQATCAALTTDFFDAAADLGFLAEEPAGRGAHLFGLRAPAGIEPGALAADLARRGVSVSIRGTAVRVAPHVYNRPEDLEALLDGLRSAVGARTAGA